MGAKAGEYHEQLSLRQDECLSLKNAVQLYKDEAQAQEAQAQRNQKLAEDHEAEARELGKEIDFMRTEFRGLLSEADGKIEGLYGELASRDQALGSRSAQLEHARRELDGVLGSTSWKLTAGLRKLVNAFRSNKASSSRPAIEDQRGAVKLDYKPFDDGS